MSGVLRWLAYGLIAMAMAPCVAQDRGNFQGLWWADPPGSESGWGINITHQGNILFATWFTYDIDGRGRWFVVPSAERVGDSFGPSGEFQHVTFSGTIYTTRLLGGNMAQFDPLDVARQPIGTVWFRFRNPEGGEFEYSIFRGDALRSVHRTKFITRQDFGRRPECLQNISAPTVPNYQDLWWASPPGSESGWGLNIAHQGDLLFVTWFTYGTFGLDDWLVMPRAERIAPNTFHGVIMRTRGPSFANTFPFDNNAVTRTTVGSAILEFTDAGNGVFAYTLDGVSRSKPITRQVFSAPPTVCR